MIVRVIFWVGCVCAVFSLLLCAVFALAFLLDALRSNREPEQVRVDAPFSLPESYHQCEAIWAVGEPTVYIKGRRA